MKRYNPSDIEPKWQKIWEKSKTFKAEDLAVCSAKGSEKDVRNECAPKMYVAGQFPYPSGAGLHAGHARVYTITDLLARFYRQLGHNVMNPVGWDTFGLPAENYAIKTGVSPQEATKTNIRNFKEQFKRLGISIDWDREINTSDPEYYKWTQWIFTKMFEKGLAYQSESYQWWCPVDKTVLANEQVEGGKCWRCGSEVEKKKMKQWFFRITAYAEELLAGLEDLDWPENVKAAQRNWIGRSEGAEIEFEVLGFGDDDAGTIKVFTTRPDTVFGATFMVLAPEHPLVGDLVNSKTRAEVDAYREQAMRKSEIERQENKEKTGVFTGSYAINPATGEKMPIWIADYVLIGYGEGAIMAVPAHDERDKEFAEKFGLPIKKVIEKPENSDEAGAYAGEGMLVNSGAFNGMQSSDAREDIVAWLEDRGIGKKKVTYRMRDWLISRQRYWGAPIPIAYDSTGKAHAVPEDKLPVVLPEISDYQPDDSGRSALAKLDDWKIEIDGEEMQLETDTMDGFACSSWYLLRYADPKNKERAWDPELANYWNPVDVYVGGDHATTHQLYVRMWTMFFKDLGLTEFSEPIKKFIYHGYILAEDGTKMSKSKGNVIDPLTVVDQGYGADALRTYILFMGPYEANVTWSTAGLGGVHRFLNRVWNVVQEYLEWKNQGADGSELHAELLKVRHTAVKQVTKDLYKGGFNTAVAALMEFTNELYRLKLEGFTGQWQEVLSDFARILAPFAPHMACEIFELLGNKETIEEAGWPEWDDKYLVVDEAEVVVQVNGKLRGKIVVATDDLTDDDKVVKLALGEEKVQKHVEGKEIMKTIYVQRNKLVNIVVK